MILNAARRNKMKNPAEVLTRALNEAVTQSSDQVRKLNRAVVVNVKSPRSYQRASSKQDASHPGASPKGPEIKKERTRYD
jgi:hypothetical protein